MQTKIKVAEAFRPLFLGKKRYRVYYGGRGGAKSWAYAQALVIRAAQQPLRILCTREFQASIRESVHRLLCDTIERCGLSDFYEIEQQGIHGRNGSHFFFEGLRNNVSKIKSIEGINICWCEEAEAITEHSWEVLIPTIREAGSEIWVSFNPQQEHDATYQRFIAPYLSKLALGKPYEDDRIYVRQVSWRDNPWFPDELRAEMEMLREQDYNKYLHIWEGECRTAIEGAIYGEQLAAAERDGRITRVPIVTGVPVNTYWDLGRNDTTAIWFAQHVGKEHRMVDYYEHRLVGLDHYVKVLREKGYLYGEHYLPHDVEVTDLTTNLSRRQRLEEMGIAPITVVPRTQSIEDAIDKTRSVFSEVWFDRERCRDGLDSLRNYQYLYDEKYNTFRRQPLHNWASNGADAFRQFAQGYMPPVEDDTVWRRPVPSQRFGTGWMY